jgi:hypothetical protein
VRSPGKDSAHTERAALRDAVLIMPVEPLWKAITECLDKNKRIVTNNCDSLGALQGANSAGLNFWPAHTLPTFNEYGGTATTLVPGTGQISISSFGPALGNYTVVLTPNCEVQYPNVQHGRRNCVLDGGPSRRSELHCRRRRRWKKIHGMGAVRQRSARSFFCALSR